MANYALNTDMKMNNIREDANLNDYEVNINNNDKNITIKCSSVSTYRLENPVL